MTKGKASSFGTIGFMIAAIVFAAVAGILLSQVMESTYSQEPVKPIVVAARRIPAGALLDKKDFKLVSWPESAVPKGAYKKIEDLQKVKRVPLIPFVAGEPVLVSHLSKPNSGMGIAPLVDMDKRAISIKTDNPVTLARLIYPGAHVDVLVTMRNVQTSVDDNRPPVSTLVVLQDIKVLAVGEDIDPLTISNRKRASKKNEEGALGGGESADSREARGVVTLLVTPDESEQLTLAVREGKIDIILRNPKDRRKVETKGATPAAFMPESEDDENMDFLSPEKSGQAAPSSKRSRRRSGRRSGRSRIVRNPKVKEGNVSGGIRIIR